MFNSGDRFYTTDDGFVALSYTKAERKHAAALARRCTALADMLVAGALEAWAVNASTGISEVILPGIWRDRDYSFDADANHILERNSTTSSNSNWVRWKAVMLKRPQVDAVDVHKERGAWYRLQSLTKGQRAILEAIRHLYPDGPPMLPIKLRDAAINDRLKTTGLTVGASPSSIQRTFARIDYRRP